MDSCPCDGAVDDVSNFMDGSPDTCLLHFTCNQAQRMHALYWAHRSPQSTEALREMVQRVSLQRVEGAPPPWCFRAWFWFHIQNPCTRECIEFAMSTLALLQG